MIYFTEIKIKNIKLHILKIIVSGLRIILHQFINFFYPFETTQEGKQWGDGVFGRGEEVWVGGAAVCVCGDVGEGRVWHGV